MLAKLPADRQALLTAADLIELHGHCKHARENEAGAMCALGAISKAATGDARLINYWQEPCLSFEKHLGKGVAFWNNEPERTPQEVVAALRCAAFNGL